MSARMWSNPSVYVFATDTREATIFPMMAHVAGRIGQPHG